MSQEGENRISQIGSVTSMEVLESLWAALHTVLDPSSEGPFASVSQANVASYQIA
jgi:hypothetical protein